MTISGRVLRLAVVWAIVIGVTLYVAISLLVGGGGYLVRAELQDAGGLMVHSSVKVDGVDVGTVKALNVTPRTTVIATLQLDKSAAPIGAGATVQVRPSTLLGEEYADLSVGDLSRPQPSGSFIPLSRTSDPVMLDNILDMMQPNVRTALGLLINEAGIGLMGRGTDVAQLLSSMPPSLQQTHALLSQIGSQDQTLESLISEGRQVTQAIYGSRDQLGQLVGQASRSLSVIANEHAQLGQTIAAAPAAFSQLTSTLATLRTTANDLTPAAERLSAATPLLAKTLRLVPPFAGSARGTLTEARRVAPTLANLGAQGTAPLSTVGALASNLSRFSSTLAPSLDMVDARGMKDLLWFVQNWARAMQNRDSLGHFVHVIAYVNDQTVLGVLRSYLNQGGVPYPLRAAQKHPAGRAPRPAPATPPTPSVPRVTPAPSPPATAGGHSLAPIIGAVGHTLGTVTRPLNGLGQTVQGVGHAVSSLLGGLTSHGSPGASSAPAAGSGGLKGLLNYLLGP